MCLFRFMPARQMASSHDTKLCKVLSRYPFSKIILITFCFLLSYDKPFLVLCWITVIYKVKV